MAGVTHTRAVLAGASVGLLGAAAESLRPSLTPRSTLHQGLVTGVMATTGAVVGASAGWLAGRVIPQSDSFAMPAAVVVGTAAGSVAHGWRLSAQQDHSHEEWGPHDGHGALGAAAGALAATGFAATGAVAGRGLGNAGRLAATRLPGPPVLWTGLFAGTAAGIAAGGMALALRRVLRGLAKAGREADVALAEPTTDPFVSGGPGSAVDYDTLSREGRRFVAWRVSQEDLARAGVEAPAEPVRVYVGIDTASGISARVDLAIAELDRLGAFDKSAIIAVSPAGSGYANSVPVEALEYLTGGDCAAVSVQYGVLPSMFSRDRLPLAAQTFRLLLDRIRERTREQPEGSRPKLYLYGESLGAQAAEQALRQDPSLVDPATAAVTGVAGALFVGTPGGPSLRDDLLHHPRTVHVDQWQALPDPLPAGVQLWFLEHDADPVTRFRRDLLIRRPTWLATAERGRNVPAAMRWRPVGTWQQVLLDVAYATQAQSGVFRSVGHDYRADLAPLVAAAFAPDRRHAVAAVQAALADREVTRDRRLAAAEGEAAAPADPGAAEVTAAASDG